MHDVSCECGAAHYGVRVLPLRCRCGKYHGRSSAAAALPRPKACPVRRGRPRSFGRVLRDLAGCGCNALPWASWDRRGLDWCRANAEQIAARLSREPKTGLTIERAREMVALAIEIAARSAGGDQPESQGQRAGESGTTDTPGRES